MSRGLSRAERLREMERLYVQHAFTDIEMGVRLGVDRTTVYKDRILLETRVPLTEMEPGRHKIDRARYVSEIRVNLHEALAIYLATRRASRQTRIAQPHVASALEKMAAALKQPMTERLVRAAGRILTQTAQPERVRVIEALATGWVEQRKVRLTHQGLHARRPMTYTVSPYLIEPSLWSDGAYLIGYSDVHNGLATFKVERIEHATLTGEVFSLPEDFDEEMLWQQAWGIWYGEGELTTVRLRFQGSTATRRLQETIWHPTQKVEAQPNGDLIWSAPVAEPQEMLPWIRGWGADCEVLEPATLRRQLEREVLRLAQRYQIDLNKPSVSEDDEDYDDQWAAAIFRS